jgi:glycerophosphoryl diester phosphodiesterase
MRSARPELGWLLERYISHRGFHTGDGERPENSLKAFASAVACGYGIELDVRLSADRKAVVFHDLNLQRMTGMDKSVSACTAEELGRARLLGSDQKIPLLKEVIDLVRGRVPLLVEIKNDGKQGALEEAVWRELSLYKGNFAIQSFNPFSLGWFRVNAPEVVRGQLSCDFREEDLFFLKKLMLRNLLMNWKSVPHFLSYDVRCLPFWAVRRLRSLGVPVLGWTVRSRAEHLSAQPHVDNIIFESFVPEPAPVYFSIPDDHPPPARTHLL